MEKRLILIAMMLVTVGLIFQPAIRAEVKIGFVNPQKIIEDSVAGKAAYASLKQVQESHRQVIEGKKAEIDGAEEELQKQYFTLSESARAEKEEAIRKAKTDFKRMLEDADGDLSVKEKSYLEKIDKEVMQLINKIAKDEGYSIILGMNGPSVLYADPGLDLTDKVVKAYDATKQ